MVDISKFKELPKPSVDKAVAASREYAQTLERRATRLATHFAGDESPIDQFVQVECGFKHTLLLNKRGQVFAFGSGMQGQLGIGTRPMLHFEP